MPLRLKRQLVLIGESVESAPPRDIAGAPRTVRRIVASARSEDLAQVKGVGPFSALRGTVDFIELPFEARSELHSRLTLVPAVTPGAFEFRVELCDILGLGRPLEQWRMPVEMWLELPLPADPSVDPTDPWTWDVEQEPELPLLSISMHSGAREDNLSR